MKNILLPTDFSENSWNAIVYALDMFAKTECTFYLFTINRIPAYTGAQTSIKSSKASLRQHILEESEKDLQSLLERIKERPLNAKHAFETLATYDYFRDAVRKTVAHKTIDLIVMGTKGASGLKKVTVGSNTVSVIKSVPCPVLAVPEKAIFEGLREIAFITDFNMSFQEDMLRPLTEMASLNEAPIRVLSLGNKQDEPSPDQIENKENLERGLQAYEHSFHRVSNTHHDKAVQCFAESREVDMIAMVAKNRNFFQRILFDPEIADISYHVQIPFLVLHE